MPIEVHGVLDATSGGREEEQHSPSVGVADVSMRCAHTLVSRHEIAR